MPTPVIWPTQFRPLSQEFYLQTLSVVFTNPYTSHQQVLERDGQRWLSRLTLERGGELACAIDAFLAAVRGPAGIVMVPDFRTLAARGSVSGAPQLVAGSGRTLTVNGFTANAAGVLLPGDLIQTSEGRAHLVTLPVNADPTGAATVTVEPRLRTPITVGPLVTTEVRVKMRLTSDDATRNPTKPPRQTAWQLEFVEVLPGYD